MPPNSTTIPVRKFPGARAFLNLQKPGMFVGRVCRQHPSRLTFGEIRAWLVQVAALCCVPALAFAQISPEGLLTGGTIGRVGRAANFYTTEHSYNDQLCADVRRTLNEVYWLRRDLRMPTDYARIESEFYLGTHQNVRWSMIEFPGRYGTPVREIANIDLFNTGEMVSIVRVLATVSSAKHHRLYFADQSGAATGAFRFNPDLERQRRFSQDFAAKLEYSVVDFIRVSDRWVALLKPLRDLASEERLYVLLVYGVSPPGGVVYDLICTLAHP